MMKQTPASREANSAQRVMKSLKPQEEIKVNITKNVTGSELDSVLQGVGAFTKCFNQDDKYVVDIKVEKVILEEQEASTEQA